MIIKNQEEIEILREGGARLAKHVRALCAMVRPGITPAELEHAAREMVAADGDLPAFLGYKQHGEREGYPSALCVSINEAVVHGAAALQDTSIEEGDIVSVDFGIFHRGLCTDHAATVIAGKARDPHDEELVRGTKEALDAGIKAARVGGTTGDIGYAVQQIAEKYGFGYPKDLSGHGVGRTVHEEPYVPNYGERGEGVRLVEGLVIAIEPMMTLGKGAVRAFPIDHSYRTKDSSRAAHFEHTILITKDGPEVLTR